MFVSKEQSVCVVFRFLKIFDRWKKKQTKKNPKTKNKKKKTLEKKKKLKNNSYEFRFEKEEG
jgi:hypothetical protein